MVNKASKKNNNNDEVTFKDACSELDVSETTLKRYIKDFDLSLEKGAANKSTISQKTFQALSEIVKLRTNGLSIQEIKELKSQGPTKHILEAVEEEVEQKKDQLSDIEPPASQYTRDELNVANEVLDDSVEANGSNASVDVGTESEKTTETEGDFTKQFDELGEVRRRRGFNYRYVERQISNDSKRVSSLKRRLQNPNISVQERLFFEEALERRILFLNGWKHILKWVSKQ